MRVNRSLLWSLLICAARAKSDATVYLFPEPQRPSSLSAPTLTPAEARLIFAQRLGVSQYHGLEGTSGQALSYINTFGGLPASIFQSPAEDRPAELVLVLDGLSSEDAKSMLTSRGDPAPAFDIARAPSWEDNEKLVADLNEQTGAYGKGCPLEQAINPFDQQCWNGRTKILHVAMGKNAKHAPTLEELSLVISRMLNFVNKQEMNAMIAVMPISSSSRTSYGNYDMPSQKPLDRRALTEEPIAGINTEPSALPVNNNYKFKTSNTSSAPVRGVIPNCFSTLDACNSGTNNCSSHGSCQRKFGSSEPDDHNTACFTCLCGNTTDVAEDGTTIFTEWGGAACQKRDISAPFWLIATSSVVLVGLVSWAIGMMFSVGEEKLPGVIGAGVSSGKSR